MKKNTTPEKTAQLKTFRRGVSLLKRKGLISKDYDARSVTPTKYLNSQLKRFANVIEGKAVSVKVNKKKQAQYKERGFDVKSGRVVVPVAENEKVYSTHGDFRVKTLGEFGSITRIDLGLSKNDLHLWQEQLLAHQIKLKQGESIYFQFYGHNSYKTFPNFEEMIRNLNQYETFENVDYKGSAKDHSELIENIVIYRIDRDSNKPPRQSISPEANEARRISRAEKRQRYLDRMTPERAAKYNEKRAEDERRRREKQKTKLTPEQIAAQKAKARERARKSYNDRSGKNGKKDNSGN